jgi:hypothetical protein
MCLVHFEDVSSLHSDSDHYIIITHYIVFSTQDGSQNCHTGVLIEHTGSVFYKVAYWRYNVPSKMFQTDSNTCYKTSDHRNQTTISPYFLCISYTTVSGLNDEILKREIFSGTYGASFNI